jgi:hypothetical protein
VGDGVDGRAGSAEIAAGPVGAGGAGAGADEAGSVPGAAVRAPMLARGGIGTNSPGRQVCGWRRTVGSLTKRSACPQPRQIRVPRASSPLLLNARTPRPIVPVLRFSAQTKSFAPQLLQTATPLPAGREPRAG